MTFFSDATNTPLPTPSASKRTCTPLRTSPVRFAAAAWSSLPAIPPEDDKAAPSFPLRLQDCGLMVPTEPTLNQNAMCMLFIASNNLHLLNGEKAESNNSTRTLSQVGIRIVSG